WTASPEFLVFEGRAQDVAIRALVQPDHAEQGERHVAAARLAVEYFQDHYGDYPYPNLTVVDPRRGAEGSGGMEYPTLITAGTYYNLPAGLRILELVIIHEFGHNYWYHLLANNEFEEAWLDEGINTYTEGRVLEDRYGGNVIDLLGFRITEEQVQRVEHIVIPMTDPVYRKAWEYYSPSSYGVSSYARPGLILKTLRNYLGPETMNEAMRAYVSQWRFKHPKTADFVQVMSDVAGEDLSWYFDQALFTNAVLDYSVSAVESEEIVDAGYGFDRDIDEPRRAASEVSDASGQDADHRETDPDVPGLFESEVSIRRLGEFRFPVEIEIVFEDGEVIRESWDGEEPWKKLTYLKPVRLSSAAVDPDKKIPLDRSYTNNSRTLEPRRLGINKVVARWTFWWQCLLDLLAL
ncbi:MAG TPA: M1 family aminopeptidase, partial [Vicinamibacteria bacterium]